MPPEEPKEEFTKDDTEQQRMMQLQPHLDTMLLEIYKSVPLLNDIAECINAIPEDIDRLSLQVTLEQFFTRNGYLQANYIYPPPKVIRFIKVGIFKILLSKNNPVSIIIIWYAISNSLNQKNYMDPEIIAEDLLIYIRLFKDWLSECMREISM